MYFLAQLMMRKVILLVNIQILVPISLRYQEVLILLLMNFGRKSLIRFNKVLYQTVSCKSRIFISKQVSDVGDLYLLFILDIAVTNLRLNVLTVELIHFHKAILLLFHIFEYLLSRDYLNFTPFIDEKEDIYVFLLFFPFFVLCFDKNVLLIILLNVLLSILVIVEIVQVIILVSSCVRFILKHIDVL